MRATVIIRMETKDFETWRAACGADARRMGASEVRLYRDLESPSEVFAVIDWEDAEEARAFLGDAQTKARMLAAGVVGVPDLRFVREV